MDKLELILAISEFHPSAGVHKGWSHYTGGMKDDGDWYFRTMAKASEDELKAFLEELKNPPPPLPPSQEEVDLQGKYRTINGVFMTEYSARLMERRMAEFGSAILMGRDGKGSVFGNMAVR